MKYRIEITLPAEKMFKELRPYGKKTLLQLRELILGLADDPESKTEPLHGLLNGYRSLHSGRFRIVVKISRRTVTVYVVGVGFHASGTRADVYQIVQRALAAGALQLP